MDTNEDRTITLQTQGGTIYAPDWPAIAKLFSKIAAAQAAAATLKKDGKHQLGYNYTTWAETVAVAGNALATAKLAFTATVIDAQRLDKVASVRMCFTLADTDTGAMIVTNWQADGATITTKDGSQPDITKATTNAAKHWLTKTFLLTDHEDTPPQTSNSHAASQATATQATATRPAVTSAPVNKQTGEIHEAQTADDAQTRIPAPPAADAANALKWNWFGKAAKAAGWTNAQLTTWLKAHYEVTTPPALNGRTDDAMAKLYAELTGEIPYLAEPRRRGGTSPAPTTENRTLLQENRP